MTTRERGVWGEGKACDYLRAHGYDIIERNAHVRWGEIDIVARRKGAIIFVEVKTRALSDALELDRVVSRGKRQRLKRAGTVYLEREQSACGKLFGAMPRWETVFVLYPPGVHKMSHGYYRVMHIKLDMG